MKAAHESKEPREIGDGSFESLPPVKVTVAGPGQP